MKNHARGARGTLLTLDASPLSSKISSVIIKEDKLKSVESSFMYTYVLLRNSLVVAHCCLTRDSNSAGVTGRPEANSFSPSTNLTSQNLKKHNRELMIKNYHFGLKSKPKAQNLQRAKKVMSDSAGVTGFCFQASEYCS